MTKYLPSLDCLAANRPTSSACFTDDGESHSSFGAVTDRSSRHLVMTSASVNCTGAATAHAGACHCEN